MDCKKAANEKNAIATMNPAAARVSVVSALRTTSTAGNCRHVVSRIMLEITYDRSFEKFADLGYNWQV